MTNRMDLNKWVVSSNRDGDDRRRRRSSRPWSSAQAQQFVREQIASDRSLVDELIAERRDEARREN
jgi:hypothetical protein